MIITESISTRTLNTTLHSQKAEKIVTKGREKVRDEEEEDSLRRRRKA